VCLWLALYSCAGLHPAPQYAPPEERGGDAVARALARDRAVDGVDLRRAARRHVLEHGRAIHEGRHLVPHPRRRLGVDGHARRRRLIAFYAGNHREPRAADHGYGADDGQGERRPPAPSSFQFHALDRLIVAVAHVALLT